jgi:NitT/TauT family transport system substrate-binding protein
MIMRTLRAVAIAAFTLLAIAPPVQAQNSDNKIHVLAVAIDLYAGAYYAQAQGFFKQAGVDVDITTLANGNVVGGALAGGAGDIGVSNLVQIAAAVEHGVPLTVIAGAGMYSSTQAPSTALCVSKTSTLKIPKDLEGKTIAVAAVNDQTSVALRKWLTDNGGDYNQLKLIEMGYPEMIAALSAGRIDAAMLAEPFQTAARKGDARLFGKPFDAISPEFNIGVWATTRPWAQAHPDLVKKFVGAIYEAAKWANTHHAESAQILAKEAKADPDRMGGMIRALQSTDLQTSHIQPPLDVAFQFHLINKKITAADLIWIPAKP